MLYMYERELLGELILNYLTKITLPESVLNELGNVFVPNGKHKQLFSGLSREWVRVKFVYSRDQKSMGMAMFKRTFARTSPDNLRAPHMKYGV